MNHQLIPLLLLELEEIAHALLHQLIGNLEIDSLPLRVEKLEMKYSEKSHTSAHQIGGNLHIVHTVYRQRRKQGL